MTLYQFNMLDEMEQIEAIWYKSVKIAEREDDINRYTLYQIDAFYVEEEWHKEYDVRRAYHTFLSTNAERLKPYLEKIVVTLK